MSRGDSAPVQKVSCRGKQDTESTPSSGGTTHSLLAHFIGDVGWKRLEANVITCPTWMLECCTLAAATGAASARLVCRLRRPVPHKMTAQRKRAAHDAGNATPKASLAVAHRASVVVQFHACQIRQQGAVKRRNMLSVMGGRSIYKLTWKAIVALYD
jgi:hypothetical protein